MILIIIINFYDNFIELILWLFLFRDEEIKVYGNLVFCLRFYNKES